MSLKINIGKKNVTQLNNYIENLGQNSESGVSAFWDRNSKHSLLRTENDNVIFDHKLFSPQYRLRFDSKFLKHHGFKEKIDIKRYLKQAMLFLIRFRKELLMSQTMLEIKTYSRIWDNIEHAIHSTTMIAEKKDLTWEIIKSYNYYNELSPLIDDLENPTHYLEIGSGGCHLPTILKKHANVNLKYVFVELKSTIPFGFVNICKYFPHSKIILPHQVNSKDDLLKKNYDFMFITNEQIDLVPSNMFDIAVNTDSFMEMLPKTIAHYFSFLRRVLKNDNIFFCHNRAEKIMSETDNACYSSANPNIRLNGIPIRFSEYPWLKEDVDYFYYSPIFTRARFRHSFFCRATKLDKCNKEGSNQ